MDVLNVHFLAPKEFGELKRKYGLSWLELMEKGLEKARNEHLRRKLEKETK